MYPLAWVKNPNHWDDHLYKAAVYGCKNRDCSMHFDVIQGDGFAELHMYAVLKGKVGKTKVIRCKNAGMAMQLGNKSATEFLNYIARGLIGGR